MVVDRKILAELAATDMAAFEQMVATAKKGLEDKAKKAQKA